MIAVALVCAIGCGVGIVGLLRGRLPEGVRDRRWSHSRLKPTVGGALDHRLARRILIGVGAGLGAFGATRWPSMLVVGGLAGFGLPVLLDQTSGGPAVTMIESIATWTEMLQGTLASSAGLSQSIVTTASIAPLPVRPATMKLASRLNAGIGTRDALLEFADELDDASADRVVCALLLASTSRSQRVGELLSSLAESTREEVAMRLRIETSRASVRSGVRTVLVFSVAFAAALALVARSYLAPFDSASGQVILLGVGALYASGLILMVVLSQPPPSMRLLGHGEAMP